MVIVAYFQISRAEPLTKIILEKLIQLINKSVTGKNDVNRLYTYFHHVKAFSNIYMIKDIQICDYNT